MSVGSKYTFLHKGGKAGRVEILIHIQDDHLHVAEGPAGQGLPTVAGP